MRTILRSGLLLVTGAVIGVLGYPLLPSSAESWVADRQTDVRSMSESVALSFEGEPSTDHRGRVLERPWFCDNPSSEWKVTRAPLGLDLWTCVSGGSVSYHEDEQTAKFRPNMYANVALSCQGGGSRSDGSSYVSCNRIVPPTATPTTDPAGPRPDWCQANATWRIEQVPTYERGAYTCTTPLRVTYEGNWPDIKAGCVIVTSAMTGRSQTTCPR